MQHFNPLDLIKSALNEDINGADHTALACLPAHKTVQARITAKQNGIISGVEVAQQVFNTLDKEILFKALVSDSNPVKTGQIVIELTGNAQSILTAERVALNFLQRMSGVATLTHDLQSKIAHTNCKLLDTRKTTPGFRYFEKLGVKHGGALNHRFGLYDMMMIKDNHIDFCGGINAAVDKANKYREELNLPVKLEVECRTAEDVMICCGLKGIDRIMFDNFQPAEIELLLKSVPNNIETEASGGINESNLVQYAETGVNFISMGALTHSYKSLDLSLTAS